jgi:probable HAF family extracellular repeat protein
MGTNRLISVIISKVKNMRIPFTKMQGVGNDFVVLTQTDFPVDTNFATYGIIFLSIFRSFPMPLSLRSHPEINRRQVLALMGGSLLGLVGEGCGGGGGDKVSQPTPTPTPLDISSKQDIQVKRWGEFSPSWISSDGKSLLGSKSVNGAGEMFYWNVNSEFIPLNEKPQDLWIKDMSNDGKVIIGHKFIPQSDKSLLSNAFYWTPETGMIFLPKLGNDHYSNEALSISDDGKIIVGTSFSSSGNQAFRWTKETGTQNLGKLRAGATSTRASAISGDGKIIVGVSGSEAFRWTAETGMIGLGYSNPLDTYSDASHVSYTGEIIVGMATNNSDNLLKSIVWTKDGKIIPLKSEYTQFVSEDDDFIIGYEYTDQGRKIAFFYETIGGAIIPIGHLYPQNEYTTVDSFSKDGSILVGSSSVGFNPLLVGEAFAKQFEGFIWTKEKGIKKLLTVLIEFGADMKDCTSIGRIVMSSDGKSIAGTAIFNGKREGFLVHSPMGLV